MRRGAAISGSIFLRRRAIWPSIARSVGDHCRPLRSIVISSRVITRPGLRTNSTRMSNSASVRSVAVPSDAVIEQPGLELVPAQDAANPHQDLADMKWFDDIVVRTMLQPGDPVDRLGPRRDHDDGKIAHFPNLACQLESVLVAKQEVKRDQADVWFPVETIE